MKLYSTTTSERQSRPAKKGGDVYLIVQIQHGNRNYARLSVDALTGDIVLKNGEGKTVYRKNAVEHSEA